MTTTTPRPLPGTSVTETTPSYERSIDHNPGSSRLTFAPARRVALDELDPILQAVTHQLLVTTLSADHRRLLPKASTSLWSMATAVLSRSNGVPTALSGIKRSINQVVTKYAPQKQSDMTAREIDQLFASSTPEWHDTAGFVAVYRRLVEADTSPVSYKRIASPLSSFPLLQWWDFHLPHCQVCTAHEAAYPSRAAALRHNTENPCYFGDILSWLSGGWRLPLKELPSPGEIPNHPSMGWSPVSMRPEVKRMLEWRVISPGQPHLVHPGMAVIRDSELYDACRILEAIKQPSPSVQKKDIDAINAHIKHILASDTIIPSSLGILKPIKVRFCLDMSAGLNPLLQRWPFSYSSPHDAVALLQSGAWMAKIDLERYFNQLPLHPADYPLLGAHIPNDLHPDPGAVPADGLRCISRYAHFGGSPFPALANGTMAATSDILRQEGIPNTFMTDDLFVTGRTESECDQRLAKAVTILRKLGWRLQESKLTYPAQRMPFLGIMIDSVKSRLSIPTDKLDNYCRFIRQLQLDASTHSLTVGNLESLLGKLNWIAEVLIAGRIRLRYLRKCIPGGGGYHPPSNQLVSLSPEAQRDMQWWLEHLTEAIADESWVPFWHDRPPVYCSIYSDASGTAGYGLVLGDQVYQGTWTEAALPESSGFKELVPILLALHRLPSAAEGRIIVITTEILSNVYSINKGTCRSDASFEILARIFELAAAKHVYLVADWVPREQNDFCDIISKDIWLLD